MKIDWDKPVQTIGGKKVRIYARDGGGMYPVHGAVMDTPGTLWRQQYWTSDGKFRSGEYETQEDLVNVPNKVDIWINIYRDDTFGVYPSREQADRAPRRDRLACVNFKSYVATGEGL